LSGIVSHRQSLWGRVITDPVMRKLAVVLILVTILLVACNSPGFRELRGENAPAAETPQPAWAAGMPPELAERTYQILESVMQPEYVVVVLVCFTHERDEEMGLACMGVHPGVFAVAMEQLNE